ncbi:hypothetical protein CHLRE_14g624600v5 [Chlamydomonas reinhardtii]|uniref:Myb-like domain-containing protein n=1 Tax=Chlamydomonas reinhardtii TaxID=3055 RepID=A0A2K3CY82_CHLRE|nr:uncharacterized protein CHLRE_14g624600v5 [Chlamydomonas reinhardtii]PNW73243.1 hypothetical protein CHLRE_14g624600v5 [Chlamydomonas reinhardtii]
MEASPGPSSATGAAGTRTSGRARKPRGEFWMNADGNKSQSKLLLDFPELSERKQGTGTCAPKSQGKGSTGRHGTGPTSELKSPVSAKPGRPRRLSAALAALAQPDDQEPRSTGPGEDRETPLQRGSGGTPERPRQSHKAYELSSPGQSPAAVARRPATRSTPAKEPVPDSAAATHSDLAAAAPKSAAHKLRVSSADGTGVAAAVPTVPAAAAAAVIAPAVTSPRKKASAKELQMLGSINVIRFVVDEGEAGKRATRARGVAAPVPTGHAAAVTASTATAATGAVRQAVLNGGTATSKAAREPEARARVAVPAATAAAGAGGMGDCAAVVAVMGLGVDEDGGAPQGSPPAPDLQRTSARHGAGRGTAGAAAGGSSRAGSARGRSSSGKAKSAGGTVVGSGKQQGPSGSAPQPALGARPAAAAAPAPAVQPEADQDEEAARPRKRSRKGGRTDVTHAAAPMPQPAPQPAVAASTGAGAAGVAPHAAEGPSRSLSRRSGRAAGPSVATASVQPPPATADRPVSMVAATATTATVMTAGAGGDDAGQGMAGDAGGSKARSERDGKGSKGTKRRRGQNGSVATNASAEGAAAATASQQVQQQGSQQLGKEVSQLPPPQELRQGRQERPAASEAGTDSAATKNRVKAGSKGKEMAAEEKQAVTAADISKRAEAPPCVPAECSLEQQLQAQPQAQPEAVGEDGLAAAAADGHTGADEADGGWSGAMQAALVAASAAASAAKAAAAVCGARSVSPTASVAQSSAGEDAWQRRGSGAPRHTSPGEAAVAAAAAQAAAPGGTLPPPRRAPPPVPRFHDLPPQSAWQPPLAATEAAGGSDRPLSRGAARAPAAVGTAASGAGGWVGGVDMPDRMPGRERPPQQQLYRTALEDQGAADGEDGAGGFFVRRGHGEGTGGAAGPHVEAEASVTPTRRHGLSPRRQPPLQPRQPPPLGGPHVALGRSQQQDPYGLAADSDEAGEEQQQWHQQHPQQHPQQHLQQQQRLGCGNVDYYGHGSSGDGAAPPHQHQGRRPPQLHGSDLLSSPRRQSLAAPGQGQGQGQRVSYPPLQQRGAQQRQTDQQQQLLSDSRRSSHAHAGGSWQPAAHAAAGGVAGDAYWDAPGGRERVGDRAFSDRQLPMGALYGAGYGTAAAEPMEEDRDDGGHARGYPPSMSTRLQPRQHEEEQRRQQHGAAAAGGRAAAPEPDWFVRRAPGRVGPGQPERRAEAYTEQQHQQLRWEESRPHPHHAQEAAGQAAAGAEPFRAPRMRPVPAAPPPAPPPRQQQQQPPQPPQPQGQQKHAPLAPVQQAQLQGQARQPPIALQPPRQHPLPQPPGQAHSQPLPQHPPAFAIPTLRGRAHHQQHSQQQHSQPQQEARPAMSSGAATSTVASVFSDSLRRALSRADQLAQRNKTRHQEIAENEEDGWTLEQVQSLQSAYYRVDPLHPHFWREVARGVPGKTAAECFSRVFASGRDREERAALAKALRRRPAAAPAGPSGSTKPLTLAAARKWTRQAHEQEQLERLAHLGGLDRDEDDEDDDDDEEEQEEGEVAQGPAAHGRGAAGSRGGRGAGGSRGRGGRRPALAIPDDPTEMRRIIDNLQQKHQADRFITSFLRKQGGWAKWHKAVREAQDRRLRSVSTAAAAAGGSSAALGGGAAARHGPGAGAAGVAAAGGQHDSDPLARVIQRMLARDEAEELREMWRDADEAEGLQPYGGGGGAAGDGGGTAGALYGGDEEDEYDEAREREEEEMRRFLVAEGLLGPDGMPVFR